MTGFDFVSRFQLDCDTLLLLYFLSMLDLNIEKTSGKNKLSVYVFKCDVSLTELCDLD